MKTLLIILSFGLFTFTAHATNGCIEYPEGSLVKVLPANGLTVTMHPDGRVENEYRNGRSIYLDTDGTIAIRDPYNRRTEIRYPDGRVIYSEILIMK